MHVIDFQRKGPFPNCISDLLSSQCLLNGEMNTPIVGRHVYSKYILHVLNTIAKFWPLSVTGEV